MKHQRIKEAVRFVVTQNFDGYSVGDVRFGRGDKRLPLHPGYDRTLLIYWLSGNSYEYHFVETLETVVDMSSLTGAKHPNVRHMQLMLLPEDSFPAGNADNSLFTPIEPSHDRLSAIPEENPSELSALSDQAFLVVFGEVIDVDTKEHLKVALAAFQSEPKNKEISVHLLELLPKACNMELDEDNCPCFVNA